MILGDFKKTKSNDKRPSYLRYDDVFMSKERPSREQPRQHYQQKNDGDRSRSARNISSRDDYIDDAEYTEDFEDYSEVEEAQGGFGLKNHPDEQDYFSRGQSIVDERMIKYKKRQLPPLQRYGSNNPRDMYVDQRASSYWSDQDEYRQRRQSKSALLNSVWQKFIITFTSILSLVCLSWVAYNWSSNKSSEASTVNGHVLIEPEQSSFKVLPDNPGGENVPHQDKMVYERVNPNIRYAQTEERLLPPQEAPLQLPHEDVPLSEPAAEPQQTAGNQNFDDNVGTQGNAGLNNVNRSANKQSSSAGVEEYSIVDDKTYYIKISAGKSKAILDSEAKLLRKKFSAAIADKTCLVKKVSKANGERQHAILVGPFESQDTAADVARTLGGQCYIISVKE